MKKFAIAAIMSALIQFCVTYHGRVPRTWSLRESDYIQIFLLDCFRWNGYRNPQWPHNPSVGLNCTRCWRLTDFVTLAQLYCTNSLIRDPPSCLPRTWGSSLLLNLQLDLHNLKIRPLFTQIFTITCRCFIYKKNLKQTIPPPPSK